MWLDSMVTALVENCLNRLIGQNADNQRGLTRLKGKVLSVHFSDMDKKLIFLFDQQITVLASFDGEIDCSLTLALATVVKLKDKNQIASLIKENKLQLDGNIDVLQQFSSLLDSINFDLAEWLSQYTGDVVAHTFVQNTQSAFSTIKTIAQRQQRYVSEVIIEEWRLLPSGLEIAFFADNVDDVQDKMRVLEGRLNALEAGMNNKASL